MKDIYQWSCGDCGHRSDICDILEDGQDTPICESCGSDYVVNELVVAYAEVDSSAAELEARRERRLAEYAAMDLAMDLEQQLAASIAALPATTSTAKVVQLPIPNLRVRQAGG